MSDISLKPRCVDCNERAQETNTNFTLISQGWRLSLAEVDGRRVPEWRCEKCWHAYKSRRTP